MKTSPILIFLYHVYLSIHIYPFQSFSLSLYLLLSHVVPLSSQDRESPCTACALNSFWRSSRIWSKRLRIRGPGDPGWSTSNIQQLCLDFELWTKQRCGEDVWSTFLVSIGIWTRVEMGPSGHSISFPSLCMPLKHHKIQDLWFKKHISTTLPWCPFYPNIHAFLVVPLWNYVPFHVWWLH